MKRKTKVLGMVTAAVLLVTATIFGTMAYLTSTDEVTNTFTVGSVAIKLDEAEANADGTLVEGADRVKANSYKLMPGHEYDKDPVVHFADNSEAAWLFVEVTNGIAGIESKAEGYTLGTYNKKTVKVVAYAVQADGFDTASAAWTTGLGKS